jgi:electron transfer flavoprotein alpha subunit
MGESKSVMIYGEVFSGKLSSNTVELLGCGRKLADELCHELGAVLVGSDIGGFAQETITFGADKVYIVDDPALKDYQTDSYVTVMEKIVKHAMPQILLLGQTSTGRDLAPRLAFRLNTAVTMDCVELGIDPESKLLLQTKPVYGGNALATFTCKFLPQIATVRSKTMSPLEPDTSRKGDFIAFDAGIDPSIVRTKVLEKVEADGIRLEDVDVVISGGRGMGSSEGFHQLEDLARILKGAVGATRPPCDNGWLPVESQIGLTGKIVAPNLYIAIALSGASQHISGCSNSKIIVAINKDPDANIFREAHFGVVGDWEQILPAFTDKVKQLQSEKT